MLSSSKMTCRNIEVRSGFKQLMRLKGLESKSLNMFRRWFRQNEPRLFKPYILVTCYFYLASKVLRGLCEERLVKTERFSVSWLQIESAIFFISSCWRCMGPTQTYPCPYWREQTESMEFPWKRKTYFKPMSHTRSAWKLSCEQYFRIAWNTHW